MEIDLHVTIDSKARIISHDHNKHQCLLALFYICVLIIKFKLQT